MSSITILYRQEASSLLNGLFLVSMDIKSLIRTLKTSPLLAPVLALIDLTLFVVDTLAILSAGRVQCRPKSLLIVRVDVLGDYLLFRNYLKSIRNSTRFQQYTITLCANFSIRTIAETFDSDIVDTFIWTDIYKLSTQLGYRFTFMRQLRKQGFDVVFCPTFSRVLVLDDFLARSTGASERVGCLTDFVNINRWEAWFGNRLYTRMIDSGPGIVFEMERNRRISEQFLGESVATSSLLLDRSKAKPVALPQPYIVLSLGAGQDFRIWPASRYGQVAQFIQLHYPAYHIVLTGAPNEQPYSDALLALLPDRSNLLDLTGKLSIAELIYVVSNASLLITNETGIVHIAASTQTPTIVASQGKSLVRWHPYPQRSSEHIHHLYPDFVEQHRGNLEQIAPQFNPESPFPIDVITIERVLDKVQTLLPVRQPIG
ncbi:glycosyltransferase family 9 protein [Spirosoma utsteinense]|uniref:ADP-heptose:LPS heptosyltransferase n=1 Tax=Spirosoma utsteinense TaxID=2585773 RepID=A0ABR6W1G8_9BACT|nr:glycosyltransferase family 9 protein [Spirosoma utsteinense]MBC3783787.1 ADP-heptose:LPS heptosyltransferase [Spirosoma utsteinense]MBC3790069.1 ADP-heptose:LPS heptosyltransferase [Spirosoma utsteinense]